MFSSRSITKPCSADENDPLKTHCFRGKLLCRERKTQVYAKPLHAASFNTFFSTMLAWQLRGTIHGGTGGDATVRMFSFQDHVQSSRYPCATGQNGGDGALRSRLVARGALAGAQVGYGGPDGYPDSQWPRTCLICLWKPSQPLIWAVWRWVVDTLIWVAKTIMDGRYWKPQSPP